MIDAYSPTSYNAGHADDYCDPHQSAKEFKTKEEFEAEAVRHIETTLARSLFNCDELFVSSCWIRVFRKLERN